jgi:hypothetical protein
MAARPVEKRMSDISDVLNAERLFFGIMLWEQPTLGDLVRDEAMARMKENRLERRTNSHLNIQSP